MYPQRKKTPESMDDLISLFKQKEELSWFSVKDNVIREMKYEARGEALAFASVVKELENLKAMGCTFGIKYETQP